MRALLAQLFGYAQLALGVFNRVQYTTIASGQKVSGTIDLTRGNILGVAFPVLTAAESGDYFLQGGFDTTSANFLRLGYAAIGGVGSGGLRFTTGIGSCMFSLPTDYAYPGYARVEAAVAVADVRTITVLSR